ncbi:T9SS type A sorting domain-containing protein [bacterium SCSIO 12741]|nr:T9SS type A sorting domain-containing protein [bacterium SCSIO 12741]
MKNQIFTLLASGILLSGGSLKSQTVLSTHAMYGDCQLNRVGLCVDKDDNAYLLATFSQKNNNPLVKIANKNSYYNNNFHQVICAKYNAQNQYTTHKDFPSQTFGQMLGIAYNKAQNKIIAVGGHKLNGGYQKGYAMSLNTDFSGQSTEQFQKAKDFVLNSIAVSSSGANVVSGVDYSNTIRTSSLVTMAGSKNIMRDFSASDHLYITNVAIDDQSRVWGVGQYGGVFDSLPNADKTNGLILRRSLNLSEDTAISIGGGTVRAATIAISGDNVLIGGHFKDTLKYGGKTLVNATTGWGAFVLCINQKGQLKWLTEFEGAESFIQGIAINDCGNVAVTGAYVDQLKVGAANITSNSTSSKRTSFVLLLNSSGEVIWLKGSKGNSNDAFSRGSRVAFKANGNLLVAGNFGGGIIFDSDTLDESNNSPASNHANVFLVEYSISSAPYAMELSNDTIDENNTQQVTVGNLTVEDCKHTSQFTYSLVAGAGDTDNAQFTLNGANLMALPGLDFETKPQLSVRIRVTNPDQKFFEKAFTINLNDLTETVGISELADKRSIHVYPNPVKDQLHVESDGVTRVQLISIEGRVINSPTVQQNGGYLLNTSSLEPGTYVLRVDFTDGVEIRKIMKQ